MNTPTPLLLPSLHHPLLSSGSGAPPPRPSRTRPPLTRHLARWLKLLILTAPVAFLVGYTHRNEWMRAWGVVPSDFPLTTPEYLCRGLYALVSIVMHAIDLPQTRPELVRAIAWIIGGVFILFLVSYRIARFLRQRFREQLRTFQVRWTRARRTVLDHCLPEAFVGLTVLATGLLFWLILVVTFWVALVPVVAGRAGRADALKFWRDLSNPQVQNTYPTVEIPDEHGLPVRLHVIEAGPASYLLFDGQRFRVVRKELVARQLGAAPPWKS